VPPDFTGTQLSVPHPVNGVLYLKLRDDPATVQTLTLPVLSSKSPEGTAFPSRRKPSPQLLRRAALFAHQNRAGIAGVVVQLADKLVRAVGRGFIPV